MTYLTANQFIEFGETAIRALLHADNEIEQYKLKYECDFEMIWENSFIKRLDNITQPEKFIVKATLQALFESSCAEFHNLSKPSSIYDDYM